MVRPSGLPLPQAQSDQLWVILFYRPTRLQHPYLFLQTWPDSVVFLPGIAEALPYATTAQAPYP